MLFRLSERFPRKDLCTWDLRYYGYSREVFVLVPGSTVGLPDVVGTAGHLGPTILWNIMLYVLNFDD